MNVNFLPVAYITVEIIPILMEIHVRLLILFVVRLVANLTHENLPFFLTLSASGDSVRNGSLYGPRLHGIVHSLVQTQRLVRREVRVARFAYERAAVLSKALLGRFVLVLAHVQAQHPRGGESDLTFRALELEILRFAAALVLVVLVQFGELPVALFALVNLQQPFAAGRFALFGYLLCLAVDDFVPFLDGRRYGFISFVVPEFFDFHYFASVQTSILVEDFLLLYGI